MNIESLGGSKSSRVISQAKRSIRHIDDMVIRVRDQLHGRANVRTFSIGHEIEEIVKMLRHRGHMSNVQLTWQSPADKKALRCRGEPIRFRQMMANLICNGFDAYYEQTDPDERREVLVQATENKSEIIITVNDWGRGVPAAERPKLFQPFHSTKQTGMGMGLFIVKQIVEEHFLGSATIDTSAKHTAFVIKLPKASV
jgi:C4-dicarboxylate-specific signal transduction histidine kinase